MTRSSSFNGKGSAGPRQRTSSETPPTYPAAMKAASQAVINSSTPSPGGAPKATQNVTSTRTHKRASPSFSFFAGASSSMPLKAKPPPPMTVEKAPSAIAATEASASGVPFMALSGIKSGLTTSPQTRPVEVTSVIGSIGPTLSTSPQTGDCRAQSVSAPPAIEDPPVIKHWSDEKLLPALRTAITDIKNFQPGPIKEAPHVLSNSTLSPLREAWALAYVQYGEGLPSGHINMNQENMSSDQAFVEVGLTLAPPCMAMVMENPSYGGSRIVTVTKPMLIDQVMDSAGARNEFESRSVDLEVDESDSESLMSPEDNSLNQTQMLSPEDKELSILRVNSSQMLSSMDDSGTKYIPNSGIPDDNHRTEAPNGGGGSHSNNGRVRTDNQATFMLRKKAADRAWKARIRETVHSEQDLPEEVRTVARSIFKVLREFDLISTGLCEQDTFNDGHRVVRSLLQQGIEQARQFGNHASAIGFHHALRVLETSALFRQLDSSKLIYLLAMPIKHRLEHRTGRARVRTIWESYSHQWHGRVVASIDRKRENLSSLRIKMYYQTCVRTSRAFEKSLGVVGVLSRLNKAVLRKYSSMDECDSRQYSGGFDKSTTSLTDSDRSGKGGPKACDGTTCQGTCLDHPCQAAYGEASGIAIDTASRRHSGNTGAQAHANRMGKIRSSSFSTYIDNMTSRSFGAQSLLESGLSNLKEREQAHFSSNYNPNPGGTFWSHSNGSQSGLLGDADIPSDFVMDAREIEAVQRWIEASDIHNFLPGEDNFLRFCMEIELVVRGIGLGGTGIQGAGIPQTQNGIVTPSLSSSGSDFFVKEVAKFNSQFVPGMGPSEPVATQTKTASASGVAEFLVNSFKNSHAGTSAPTTSGSHFFSNATHGNGASNFGNQSGQGSSYGLQSSQTSIHSISSNTSGSKSRLQQRQAQHKPRPNHVDTIPNLLDDPQSIYASQPGPTYVLYNPPYATASHGASSSYFGSPPSGMSSTVSPHHTSLQAKDMTEFLRRIQLKLTSFVLSEWLDIFGEVEADHWLQEFLEELSDHTASGKGVRKGCDEDMLSKEDMNQDDFLPVNEMDLGDKTVLPDLKLHSLCPSSHSEGSIPNVSANSSLGSIGVGDRTDSMTSWSSRSTHTSDMDQIQPKDGSSSMESHPVGSVPSARSFLSSNKSVHSFPSMTSLASVLEIRETQPPVSTGTIKATDRQGLLNIQVSSINVKVPTPKIDPNATAPYNLHEAYRSTIEQFNQTKSPYQKLGYLFALELLIVASLSYPDSCANPAHPGPSSLSSRTKVSEAKGLAMGEQPMSPRAITPGTDAIVDEIENLFRMSGRVRPKNLLRDMQLIATFIPGSILDLRDDGKAFWDMALAVTSLKKDVITYVVQKGTQYVEMDDASTDSRQDTAKSGSRAIMQDDEERMRMSEAVRLFTIGAKESHPVAQRELAILYMSLPMLPASSSPMIGYSREDSSPLMPNSRVPSPVSFTYGKYGRSGARTTPPPSPKGTFSSTMLGTSFKPGGSGNTSGMTASIPTSIPIKQKRSRHHQHSSSGGSGSSFGSGVLSGLGIMTGLGSFTGSSSTGSTTAHDQQQPYATSTHTSNGSTVSLHLQQCGEFAEGHDIEPYLDMHAAKTSASIASYQSGGGSSSLHPYHHYNRRQQQHQQQHQQQQHQQHQASRPDKFNPESVAAAMHWFSLAAAQGDKFSINYLKHKETAGGMMG
ncbi:hypothetical protein BG005_010823 [Podila minutissima]|nr:hypothetical protein BG005_010823 [Podila minutissima]